MGRVMVITFILLTLPAFAFGSPEWLKNVVDNSKQTERQNKEDEGFQKDLAAIRDVGKLPCKKPSLFGPSTYQECLEKYTKQQKSTFAAKALQGTCYDEFEKCGNDDVFYECVRNGLDGVETDAAAKAIYGACMKEKR